MRVILGNLILLCFIVVSCHSYNEDSAVFMDLGDMTYEESETSVDTKPNLQNAIESKIIKDGDVMLEVTNLDKSKILIDSLLDKFEGFYSKESLVNNNRSNSYTLKARIPSDNFESFILSLEQGDGKLIEKNIILRDVTDKFIDLKIRLDNKNCYLEAYRKLLKEAKSVKDILNIQGDIRLLEEELESTKGQLAYLTDQVSFSTLTIYLNQKGDFYNNSRNHTAFFVRVKNSLIQGWYLFLDLIVGILQVWFLLPILPIIYFSVKKLARLRKK